MIWIFISVMAMQSTAIYLLRKKVRELKARWDLHNAAFHANFYKSLEESNAEAGELAVRAAAVKSGIRAYRFLDGSAILKKRKPR